MNIKELLETASNAQASDIFLVAGLPLSYRLHGSIAAVIRVITFSLPEPHELGIPDQVIDFGSLNKGLVLVTGLAGSGKSTTLACMVDKINNTMSGISSLWKTHWNSFILTKRVLSARER